MFESITGSVEEDVARVVLDMVLLVSESEELEKFATDNFYDATALQTTEDFIALQHLADGMFIYSMPRVNTALFTTYHYGSYM